MTDDVSSMFGSAYLNLAHRAIREAMRPLTPSEMLDLASTGGYLPAHLFGATMHKTLSARLAEHVRQWSKSSLFYRTARNTFFLHSLANGRNVPPEAKQVFIGNLRSKSIRKENVLVMSRFVLQKQLYGPFVPFDEQKFADLFRAYGRFVDRSSAELDDTIKQLVTFTLVHHDNKLLIYRRGKFTTTSDALKGQLSVGFGGHVNDQDFTLFSMGHNAFVENSARELREELFLDDVYQEPAETLARSRVVGYINVDESLDAEHHVAVLISFRHKDGKVPKKGELSINQLSWLDLRSPLNDLSDFDLWSAMILRHIYEGVIRL